MSDIRVKSGIVITVNDSGDTITVNTDDQGFLDRYLGVLEKMDNVSKEIEAAELSKEVGRKQLGFVMEKTREVMESIDDLFGRDTCRKVFGEIIPSPYLIADFFEQLTPIIDQYMDDRQKKIAVKYNGKRKGGRNRYRTKEEIIQDAMR